MHLMHENTAKRTYIKCRIWHLAGRKKQKGGFLHILGSLAKSLLVSAAGPVGGEISKGLRSKILRRGKIRLKRRRIRRVSYAQIQYFIAKASCTKKNAITKRQSNFCKISKSWQTKATRMYKDKKNLHQKNCSKTIRNQKNRSKKPTLKKTTSWQRSRSLHSHRLRQKSCGFQTRQNDDK